MPSDFIKGALVGGWLASSSGSDHQSAGELRRNRELAEEQMQREEEWRRYQVAQDQERAAREADLQSQQQVEFASIEARLRELERVSQAARINDQAAVTRLAESSEDVEDQVRGLRDEFETAAGEGEELRNRLDQMEAAITQLAADLSELRDEIPAVTQKFFRTTGRQASLPDRFAPAVLYAEYLAAQDLLDADRPILPPSWARYLESEYANLDRAKAAGLHGADAQVAPTLFICPEPWLVEAVIKLLASSTRGGVGRLVRAAPTNAGDLAGILTKLEPGNLLLLSDYRGYVSPATLAYLASAVRDYQLDIVIDQGPNARSVRLQLPPFGLYYVTISQAVLDTPLATLFPRREYVANLGDIHLCAVIGQIAWLESIRLAYPAAAALLQLARERNRLPQVFLEEVCTAHRADLEQFAAGKLNIDELRTRLS